MVEQTRCYPCLLQEWRKHNWQARNPATNVRWAITGEGVNKAPICVWGCGSSYCFDVLLSIAEANFAGHEFWEEEAVGLSQGMVLSLVGFHVVEDR